jgi:hypothetical protein
MEECLAFDKIDGTSIGGEAYADFRLCVELDR